jgi:phosphoribosylanthranilate isomerase
MRRPVRIKVCGLTRREDVEASVEAGADVLGFILAPSPRRVDLSRVEALTRGLPPLAATTAVVVDPSPGELARIAGSGLFDWVQFCGDEPPEVLRGYPGRTIRALGVAGPEDLAPLDGRTGGSRRFPAVETSPPREGRGRGEESPPPEGALRGGDLLLLDARSGGRTGGTGRPFDWGLLRRIRLPRPFFLAGGLGPENLAEALERVRPDGVDLNGRVEREPGIKDPARIRRCVAIAREHEARLEAEESRRDRSGPAGREIGA